MSIRSLVLVAILGFGPAAPAWAGWGDAFPPRAAASYLGAVVPMIVVSVDSPGEEAATALRASLTEAGAPLVMDGTALGDLSGLSDSDIVTACANMPVERILIVRVYPGFSNQTAAVTIYAADGAAAGAFNIADNEVLATAVPKQRVDAAPEPAPPATPVVQQKDAAQIRRETQYRERALWFRSSLRVREPWWAYSTTTDAMLAKPRRVWGKDKPVRGEVTETIEWHEFYALVGEKEHAVAAEKRFRTNNIGKTMRIVGVVATAVSAGATALSFAATGACQRNPCVAGYELLVPLMVTAVGINFGGWITGHVMLKNKYRRHTPKQLRQLAIDHNRALLEELDVKADDLRTSSYTPPRHLQVVGLGIAPIQAGAMLSVTTQF